MSSKVSYISCKFPFLLSWIYFPIKNPYLFKFQNDPQCPLKSSVCMYWRKNPKPGAEPNLALVWDKGFDAQVLSFCFWTRSQRLWRLGLCFLRSQRRDLGEGSVGKIWILLVPGIQRSWREELAWLKNSSRFSKK